MPFSTLGLSTEIARAVAEQGYAQPTPIQAKAIPLVLAGRDVLAAAQTGTGKTAAFTLPMLQKLSSSPRRGTHVRALILTPTRELAAQILENVLAYGQHLDVRATAIFGGVGIQPQINTLRRGVDILVATPGRLLDHVGQRTVDLSKVEMLVLDEADRMLDMGFLPDIRRVLRALPAERQNLLFSATFADEIRKLAQSMLNDPASVDVAPRNTTAERVEQHVYAVEKGDKRALLSHLIKEGGWHQVLVFSRTKHGANRLARQLTDSGISADAIHGNKSQNARTRALRDFKSGELRVLVATEIAARGIDIDALPYVVNYELPNVPEDYVHRIGRTGRADASGAAYSLVSPDEHKLLLQIERLLKRSLPRETVPGFEAQLPASPVHRAAPKAERPQGRADAQPARRRRSRRRRPQVRAAD